MDTERGVEVSLSFSCPAALRLALREEPLRIVRQEASPIDLSSRDFVIHVYPSRQPERSPLRYYFEIEGHLIDILQTRQLPLAERLGIVRRSLESLSEENTKETPPETINRLVRNNYAQIDALPATGNLGSAEPGEWLMENYFVNFLFRKNAFTKGLQGAVKILASQERQLSQYLFRPPGAQIDVEELAKRILQMELELNHQKTATEFRNIIYQKEW